MRRRSFFGMVVGLLLAPFGFKTQSHYVVGCDLAAGNSRWVTPEEVRAIDKKFWGTPSPDQPFGINYWLKRNSQEKMKPE